MKRFLAALTIALFAGPIAAPVPAQTGGAQPRAVPVDPAIVDPAAAQAFRAVISAQMAAFARDDGAAAFAFAAPAIQRLFATPERFMAMVRAGFQPVYRAQSVAFERPIRVPAPGSGGTDGGSGPDGADGENSDAAFAQPVRVTGPDGRPVLAMYHMERQPDGSWRIAGVVLRVLAGREG